MLRRVDPSALKKRCQAMSIEKKSTNEEKQFKNQVNIQSSSQKLSNSNVQAICHKAQVMRYHGLVKDAVDTTDTSIILKLPTLQAVPNQRVRQLIFKNSVYIISNWTSDKFPNVIYVCLKGYLSGYTTVASGTTYEASERVAALELDSVTALLDDSGVRTYELRYMMRDSVYWNIPLTFNDIHLTIRVDDEVTPETLPLPCPMTLNLELRRQ